MNRLWIPALLAAGLAIAACGKQGQLDQPAPLFGAKAKADYAAEKAAAKAGAATAPSDGAADQGDPAPSKFDSGANDPALRPSRSAPTPGQPPNPEGNHTGGVLPDPYADPNRTPR